ncbi:MAG: hypothetical protein MZV64_15520 [Ignavibacteriales bacterium]|nr:hypothetical protein [Ignavibacteriales bacterium]
MDVAKMRCGRRPNNQPCDSEHDGTITMMDTHGLTSARIKVGMEENIQPRSASARHEASSGMT